MVLGTNMRFARYVVQDWRAAFENLLRMVIELEDMNSDESVYTLAKVRFPMLFNVACDKTLSQNDWFNSTQQFYAQKVDGIRRFNFDAASETKGGPPAL